MLNTPPTGRGVGVGTPKSPSPSIRRFSRRVCYLSRYQGREGGLDRKDRYHTHKRHSMASTQQREYSCQRELYTTKVKSVASTHTQQLKITTRNPTKFVAKRSQKDKSSLQRPIDRVEEKRRTQRARRTGAATCGGPLCGIEVWSKERHFYMISLTRLQSICYWYRDVWQWAYGEPREPRSDSHRKAPFRSIDGYVALR